MPLSDEEAFLLAQRGQHHLGRAAASSRMCIRYCSILDERREEATKRIPALVTTTPFHTVTEQQALEVSSQGDTYQSAPALNSDTTDIDLDKQTRPAMLLTDITRSSLKIGMYLIPW